MRVSYSLGSLLSVREVAECASALGAVPSQPDTVWVPESWGAENYSMLGMLSQRLEGPRIGSSIVNVYSRSPALVAMGALTVDALSGGRMVIGLGSSSRPIVENLHGYPFKDPLARVREYVEIVRSITSPAGGAGAAPRVDHDGGMFSLGGFALLARPVRDSIPIYLAAVGERMVELAWDVADGVIFYLRPPAEIRRTVSAMRARAGGRRFDVACQVVAAVSDDAEAALARAKKTLAFYVSVGDAYGRFLGRSGYASEVAAVRSEYERGGLGAAARALPDRMASDLAVHGTAEECRRGIERFAAAGVDQPIVQFNPVGPVAESFRAALGAFSGAGA